MGLQLTIAFIIDYSADYFFNQSICLQNGRKKSHPTIFFSQSTMWHLQIIHSPEPQNIQFTKMFDQKKSSKSSLLRSEKPENVWRFAREMTETIIWF